MTEDENAGGAPGDAAPPVNASVPVGGAPADSRSPHRNETGFSSLFLLQKFTVESDRYFETVRRTEGMWHTDVHAINAVVEADRRGYAITPTDLRKRLVLSGPATSALIDRLVRDGHLTRHRSETDHRAVILHATERARQMGADMFAPLVDHMMHVMRGIHPDDIALFDAIIVMLTRAVQHAQDEVAAAQAEAGSAPRATGTPDDGPRGEEPTA
ncbi:MarR family winged helix-turn-helix transcriptional regulator [Brevibacterium ihuae]|uniref:MarR family winged helix-turn-helix transcriptional regulator n=1 Tax=Brevibacterium ihuae TaxID=1631743 RepID=UPI0015E13DF4|nr:MarR family winged helix-turn-helix transcriptional regulator [Brevibacterium ihuae]